MGLFAFVIAAGVTERGVAQTRHFAVSERFCLRLAYGDKAVDLQPLIDELGLIAGQDAGDAVFVQIVRDLAQRPALGGKLVKRPIEERGVVGFKLQLAARGEYLGVAAQEVRRGEGAAWRRGSSARDRGS